MLKGLLFNKPATVRSNLKALSATGLQTLQSSTQRGHCLLSASVRPTVGTDGASPGRSSHSYHSKCGDRSEEHTSELQSLRHLACRLLLENKNIWNVAVLLIDKLLVRPLFVFFGLLW